MITMIMNKKKEYTDKHNAMTKTRQLYLNNKKAFQIFRF